MDTQQLQNYNLPVYLRKENFNILLIKSANFCVSSLSFVLVERIIYGFAGYVDASHWTHIYVGRRQRDKRYDKDITETFLVSLK